MMLFHFIACDRLKKNDLDARIIHTHTAVVLSTSLLTWAYVCVAYFYIASPIPFIIGLVCSLVHTLSPLLFRFTSNPLIPMNVLLTASVFEQIAFSIYSGGFESNIIFWFGILPMIGGFICGKRGAIPWLWIALSVAFIFFVLDLSHFPLPHQLTDDGRSWSQALLVFGWIFLSSTMVIVYAGLSEHAENKLQEQSQKIDDLFRVLFHDLANPLGRMTIGLSIAKKQIPEAQNNRGFEIAKAASDSMIEITQNIRKMYAASKNKVSMDLSLTPLNSAIEYIQDLYCNQLENKKIKIHYDFKRYEGLNLLVEPVSFNNQVLSNIISNATKFSQEGSEILIKIFTISHDSFKIEIQDNGIGIPKELITELFNINKKTSRQGTAGESGTGFGLHITKSFVEMYGGQLLIESIEDKGTIVKLIFKGEWLKVGSQS